MICLAEEEDTLLGELICTPNYSTDNPILLPRKYASVENITVLFNRRREGIGSSLIDYALQWARKKKASSMELTMWDFNQGASEFYQQIGYRPYRHRLIMELK